MQEERVGEFLGLTAWEIPALPSQGQQPPDPLGSVLSLRRIPQPNTQGLPTPARSQVEEQRPWGLGIFSGSRASEGRELQASGLNSSGAPALPAHPRLWPDLWLLMPSSSQCYTMPLRWEKAGPWKEGVKENQKHRGAALGVCWELTLWGAGISVQSQHLPHEGRARPCCCCHGASCPAEPARLTSSSLLPLLLKAVQEDLLSFPTQSFLTLCRVLWLSQPSSATPPTPRVLCFG